MGTKSETTGLAFLSHVPRAIGGRPFTAHVEIAAGFGVIVINAGTFSPSRDLLIHELAHAWQSQHALNPKQFMVNSVASQAIAERLAAEAIFTVGTR